MRSAYVALGAAAVSIGAFSRWLATGPVPWWLLLVVVLGALAGFGHGLVSMLARSSHGRPGRLVDALGRPPRGWLVLGAVLAVSGWLLLMAGFAAGGGQPSDDGPESCRYYLSDAGHSTCVTRGEYDIAVAQAQSMGFAAAAFFLGFATLSASGRRRT